MDFWPAIPARAGVECCATGAAWVVNASLRSKPFWGMASPVPRLGLGRDRRLKQGRDFTRVKAQGKRVVKGCLIANWLALPAGSPSRVGVVTARRVGPAVVRSRARRLLRESFRLHQAEFTAPVDLVLVARPSIARMKLAEVEKDFLTALRLAGLLEAAG